jgi:hypothetical protein
VSGGPEGCDVGVTRKYSEKEEDTSARTAAEPEKEAGRKKSHVKRSGSGFSPDARNSEFLCLLLAATGLFAWLARYAVLPPWRPDSKGPRTETRRNGAVPDLSLFLIIRSLDISGSETETSHQKEDWIRRLSVH